MKNKKKEPEMLTTFVRSGGAEKSGRPEDFPAMANMLIVLLVMAMMAVYSYGPRAAAVTLECVGICWVLDIMCLIMRRKVLHIHDISPIITGLVIALMMPASVPYATAAAACIFAICIAKHPLGIHGKELINCAAAGYIFAELCWPRAVLSYPKPMTALPAANHVQAALMPSFTSSVMHAQSSPYSDFELIIGSFAGPMGCTFTVLTAVCALYLVLQKAISGTAFFTELALVLGWSFIQGGAFRMKMALTGGMLLFGLTFLSCGRETVPKTGRGKVFFGLVSGVILIAVSAISSRENPVVYAAVLAAPFGRLLADSTDGFLSRSRRAKRIFRSKSADIDETIEMIGGDGSGEN